jgi:hypothetical protein
MTPPREIELKLEVPEQALKQLMRSPMLRAAQDGIQRSAFLVSVYTTPIRKNCASTG